MDYGRNKPLHNSEATKVGSNSSIRGFRRLWQAPASRLRWFWLGGCLALYAMLLIWYFYTLKTQAYPGPFTNPLRLFGIIAYMLVLLTATYSLRRRFVRGLPGKVQNWLWMHTWTGLVTILIALLHENYIYITHDYCQHLTCITNMYWAGGALFSLILLVVSGVAGRLLDLWQTRVIAREASSNGVGIISALEQHMLAVEYKIERLCAGKSVLFQEHCTLALARNKQVAQVFALPGGQDNKNFTKVATMLQSYEQIDFQQVVASIMQHTRLAQSLHVQRQARWLMHTWRTIHIVLASAALLIISYHAVMELLVNVWHIVAPV